MLHSKVWVASFEFHCFLNTLNALNARMINDYIYIVLSKSCPPGIIMTQSEVPFGARVAFHFVPDATIDVLIFLGGCANDDHHVSCGSLLHHGWKLSGEWPIGGL